MMNELPTAASERHLLALVPLGALLAFSGCSGGGSGGGGGGPQNQGAYTVAEFSYVDPQPSFYHPLQNSTQVVNQQAEQMIVLPFDDEGFTAGGTGGDGTHVWIDESRTEGFTETPGSQSLFGANLAIRGAASGNLDDDAAREWVGTAITHGGSRVTLYSADRDPSGAVQTEVILSFDPGPYEVFDSRVELADIDGDFRDEIIVVARSNYFHYAATYAAVRVFDDPEHGAFELMSMDRAARHMNIWARPADIDGDRRPEVVVSLAGDTTHDGYHAVRLYDLPAGATDMVRVHDWLYTSKIFLKSSAKSAIGDFDGDGRDEIATGRVPSSHGDLEVVLHEWDFAGGMAHVSTKVASTSLWYFDGRYWDMTAFDRLGGHHEVAFLVTSLQSGSFVRWMAVGMRYDGVVPGLWHKWNKNVGLSFDQQLPAVAAGDMDADGNEEFQWGLLRTYANHADFHRGYLSNQVGWQTLPVRTVPSELNKSRHPVMVFGDWDADGLVLEYTGLKFLQLARPIPLAVLCAPPTVAGISQNYDDTEPRYATGIAVTESWGVTTGTTLTTSAGAEFDLYGLFKAGGRTTFERTLERSQLETTQVSYTSGYTGSFKDDTIVFQGTLQQSYEYAILSAPDPSVVGSYLTLNVPVAAQNYKWDVGYYNQQVAPEDQIGADVLTHTPGVIESYPTYDEFSAAVAGTLHWEFPGAQDVGQGLGSNDLEIAFVNESTTEEQRTVSLGGEGELGFGVTASAGGSVQSGSIYSITYSDTSSFAATVGSIEDSSHYDAWKYSWGLAVETYGRTADANNVPTGYAPGRRPFQLVRYWVNRTGSAYAP